MITVANSVMINRPLDEVFSYVGDPSNGPHWMFDCTGYIPVSDGEIGAGTRFKWVLRFMGDREVAAELRNHEPSTAQEIQVLSGAPMGMLPHLTYRFEKSGQGTRFSREVDVQPAGVFRIMAPMLRSMIKKYNARFLDDLKRVLEA